MKTPRFVMALVFLQAGIIIGLVADSVHVVSPVRAQGVPDPAGQQIQTNELLRGIDAKLARISSQLEGELKVKMTNPPEAAPARPQR